MKIYATPQVEVHLLPSDDLLTTSSLGDKYLEGGTEIDKISWNSLFE